MNSSSFVSTSSPLSARTMIELLRDLMRQCAALQLCFLQPAWDLMVPIYLGSPSEPFDERKITVLVAQVKKKLKKAKLTVLPDMLSYFSAITGDNPMIALMLNLGVKSCQATPPDYSAARPGIPACYIIHLDGSDATTFGFLKSGSQLETACKNVLAGISLPENPGQEICLFNERFRVHSLDERWARNTSQ